ncbi:hypothetical protein GCM10027436_22730 [Actinophytocola sediminis]
MITTVAIVVIAVLVIGGILLFNRSDSDNTDGNTGNDTGGDNTTTQGEIPRELRASADSDTLTTAPGNKVTVVEFLDYQCPACAAYYRNVTSGVETDYAGRITFVTRNFPLDSHPLAQPAARAAEAAANQDKFLEMYHALYDNYQQWAVDDSGERLSDDEDRAATLFDRYATEIGLDLDRFHTDIAAPAVAARIDADVAAGQRVGVDSTPTIFVNGQRFAPTGEKFSDVDRELRDTIDEALG